MYIYVSQIAIFFLNNGLTRLVTISIILLFTLSLTLTLKLAT